jgi:hypothetical protein
VPQFIPIIAYYAATVVFPAVKWAGFAAALISSVAVSARMRHMSAKASRSQWEASLRDRAVLVRSAEMPRSVTYGRVSLSGALVYARTFGALADRMLAIVALRPGHEINAIEEVFFGERSLGALDGNGYPTTGPFVTSTPQFADHASTANGGSTRAVVVSFTPVSLASTSATYATGATSPDDGPANGQLSIVSVVGTTVTVNTAPGGTPLPNGTVINVHYVRNVATTDHIRCKRYLGTAAQTADADAITDSGGEWTSNHRGRGVPVLYMWLKYNQDVYPSGVENIRCIVQGKKVYDPRTSTTVYSRNPALCARDYLTSPLGFGCSSAEIDDTLVIAAANICDEQVQITTGPNTFQNRYTCDADLSTEAARDENLQVILSSMAGFAVYSQGKWRIHAGAYSAPSVTLDEGALNDSESIAIQSRVQRSQLFNAVKGVYVSPQNQWQATDYPIVTNSTYETQDGGERMVMDLTLPATTDPWMAQRLAKIELERSRQALTVKAAFNMRAYRISAGDIIGLTLSRYGFNNKAFRVQDREFDLQRGIVLTLREEASGVYDWNFGQATTVDLAPNSTLPSPWSIPTGVTGLTLASGTSHVIFTDDGTVVPRMRVSWTALTEANVTQGGFVEIEWRQLPAGAWNIEPPVPGDSTSAYISGVAEGYPYQVRVRTRNGVNVRSQYGYAYHVVAGDTTAPPQPGVLECEELSDGTRSFDWTMATSPLDLAGFELRYGAVGSTWDSGMTTLTKVGPGVRGTEGQQPTADGTYAFAVKSFDYSGNFSAPRYLTSKLLGLAGKSLLGWGESLCPDPLMRDTAFWTGTTWTQPGFFFADSSPGNWAAILGVARSAQVWEGSYSGTGDVFMQSAFIPFSSVGRLLKLRARVWNSSNRNFNLGIEYWSSTAFISYALFTVAAGSGITAPEKQFDAVPNGTTRIKFSAHVQAGAAFTGNVAFSEVQLILAGGTLDLIGGAATTVAESKPGAGTFFIDGFNNTYAPSPVSWLNDQAFAVTCSFHMSAMIAWDYFGGSSIDHVYCQPYVRIGGTYHLGNGVGNYSNALDLKYDITEGIWGHVDQSFSLVVQAGETVTFGFWVEPYRDSAPTANDTAVYHKQETLQIQAIKR